MERECKSINRGIASCTFLEGILILSQWYKRYPNAENQFCVSTFFRGRGLPITTNMKLLSIAVVKMETNQNLPTICTKLYDITG